MFVLRSASKALTRPIGNLAAVKVQAQSYIVMASSRNSGNEVDGDECMTNYDYVFKPDLLKYVIDLL